MILFDILYQNSDLLFFGLYASTTCFLGLSFYNAWYYPFGNTQTTIETPTSDSGVETIRALSSSTFHPSPTLNYYTPDQLISRLDWTREGSIVERTFVEKAIQTDNFKFEGINLNLDLSPISLDLSQKVSPLQTFINNQQTCFCWDHPMSFSQWWLDNSISSIIANPELLGFIS
jgi:hypothetical protein